MGAEKWMTLDELTERHKIKKWRVYDMSRKGLLPIKLIAGEPVIPYQVDVEAFEKLVSTAQAPKKPSSLTTEQKRTVSGRRKVKLWP